MRKGLIDMGIFYQPSFISAAGNDRFFLALRDELAWVRHDKVPRMEYYCNEFDAPYAYGKGVGRRTYWPQPWHWVIRYFQDQIKTLTGHQLEVCFCNRYVDARDHLGWHSDNSPEMDDTRPIVSVSLGAEREIWTRPLGPTYWTDSMIEKTLLQHGSLFFMPPGFQDTHQHRIPKASNVVGERISLTFRGYVGS